jgi:HSP20 family protein
MPTSLIPRGWTRPMVRFEREMDELFNRFFGEREIVPEVLVPKANLAETDKAFEVTLELPGIKPEEVKVELRNGELWISGEKKEEKEEKGKTYHRIERRYGEFRRTVALPAVVKESAVDAQFKDGVLRVTLPKVEQVLPKKIEVKS